MLKPHRLTKSNTIRYQNDSIKLNRNYKIIDTSDDDDAYGNDNDEEEECKLHDYFFEIGPPRILRHKSQIRQDFDKSISINFNSKNQFFELELKDLMNGDNVCDFCQNKTYKWEYHEDVSIFYVYIEFLPFKIHP